MEEINESEDLFIAKSVENLHQRSMEILSFGAEMGKNYMYIACKEEIRNALEIALEYVKSDLEIEKQMYKGFEHCSDIKGIEEDIQIIQTALEKL